MVPVLVVGILLDKEILVVVVLIVLMVLVAAVAAVVLLVVMGQIVLAVGRVAGTDINWVVLFGLLAERGTPGYAARWQRLREAGAGVGTGADGALPITDDVVAEAERRGVELIAVPTPEACRLLSRADPEDTAAILHVTC